MNAWNIFIALSVVTSTTLCAAQPFFRIVDGPVITGQPPDDIVHGASWLDANTMLVRIEVTAGADMHVDPASVDYRVAGDSIRVCYETVSNAPSQLGQETQPWRRQYLEVTVPGVSDKKSWNVSFRGPCD